MATLQTLLMILPLMAVNAATLDAPPPLSRRYLPAPPPELLPLGCCFNQSVAVEGEVVLTLASKCVQLVCHNHHLVTHYVGHPDATNCCEFDGVLYPEGGILRSHCVSLTCTEGGIWVPSSAIDDCCRHCCIHDDPHFFTFDDYQYDFHRSCNYTAAQTDSPSVTPDVGVFVEFQPCNGPASCLLRATFRDNPATVVSLSNGDEFNVVVNGDGFQVPESGVATVTSSSGPHPVLAWRNAGCAFLLGSSKIMVQHCRHRLDIWAHPRHLDALNGLCGHFNYRQRDDFTARDGSVFPLQYWPSEFPASWLTPDQSDPACYAPHLLASNPCHGDGKLMQQYRERCRRALGALADTHPSLQRYIETCVFDVCMMQQGGRGEREVGTWLVVLRDNLKTSAHILNSTLPVDSPPLTLLNVTLVTCGCVVELEPELSVMAEELPRLLDSLQDVLKAIVDFGNLGSFTIISPRRTGNKLGSLPPTLDEPRIGDKLSPSMPPTLDEPRTGDELSPSMPPTLDEPRTGDELSPSMPPTLDEPTGDKLGPALSHKLEESRKIGNILSLILSNKLDFAKSEAQKFYVKIKSLPLRIFGTTLPVHYGRRQRRDAKFDCPLDVIREAHQELSKVAQVVLELREAMKQGQMEGGEMEGKIGEVRVFVEESIEKVGDTLSLVTRMQFEMLSMC